MKAPVVGLAAILALLLCAPAAYAGGAGHTRPGGSGGGGHVSGHSSGGGHSTTSRPSGSAPTRVSGRASYGYGGGSGSGYYPGYPYYGAGYWGDWGWGWGYGWYGGWWGSPWYSGGLWWPPAGYYVGAQPETVAFNHGTRGSIPAVVETDIEPRKASVRIDGEEVGRAKDFNGTWDRLTVPAGRRTLEFSAPGYMTLSTTIRLEPGKYYRIDQNLQKGSGVDPRSQSAPAEPDPQPLAQVAQAGASHASGAALQRGLLKIAADPPDAAVYLDGEFLASARELDALHGAIPVAVGQHEVEVTHPKMKSRTLRVDVSGEDPVHVDLRMSDAPPPPPPQQQQ